MRIALVIVILGSILLAGGADQAAALLAKGEAQKAAEAAQRLVEKDPKNIDAWLVLADAHLARGEPGDAWEVIERAMETSPDSAALSLKLGDVFVRMAEYEQTTSGDGTTITNYYLDAERQYSDALKKDEKLADAIYGMAFVNFSLNKKDRARKLLADCLGLNKDFGKAYALQAYIFYTERKYPEAQRLYETALKLDDSDPLTHVRYGHTFLVQNQTEQAKAAYLGAIKRHPDDETALRSGLFHLAGRDWAKAIPMLKEAVKLAPNSAPAWYWLGFGEFTGKNFDGAETAFKKARALKPKNANYAYFLGYAGESRGYASKSLDLYRTALKLNPDHTAAAARFEQLIRADAGTFANLTKLYEELIKLAPRNGWIHNNYGLYLRNFGEQRGAAKSPNPDTSAQRAIKRSGEVYEIAAALLDSEPQIQSDCGLLFEFYPCNRDDRKAEEYFTRALDISDYTYRDAFDGLNRLCRRAKKWKLLKEYAEGVINSLEGRGQHAVAPTGASAPRELKSETPGMLARAKAALSQARAHLPPEEKDG
jgi:tetratricopeptide (TPR) repeat protein